MMIHYNTVYSSSGTQNDSVKVNMFVGSLVHIRVDTDSESAQKSSFSAD
jgi:hypothetical protein